MKNSLFISLCLLTLSTADCCTNIPVSPTDGSKLVGRSMEFGQDLNSQVMVNPRGQSIQSAAPNGQKGLAWTSKYGYIALNGFGMDFPIDGMNEKGLSYGALWMPGTQYQDVSDAGKALSSTSFGPWILGNFATVDEVKAALSGVQVWGEPLPGLQNTVPPAHMIVQDLNGKSGVVEFSGGEMKFFDNPIGILTNYPSFDWHLTNLQNYINLRALNASSEALNGITLGGTGQGSGLLGIPGDWTPPSRFVRATIFQQFALQTATAGEGVNLLEHLLNTVDIPKGDALEKGGAKPVFDYTQWVVIKDLTNQHFYYRTYQDLTLHKIDFSKVNIDAGQPALKLDLSNDAAYIDNTQDLKKS